MMRNRYETINIKTLNGEISVNRGSDECRNCGYKERPFDTVLGIEELPHKITKHCMIEIAYYGQNQASFEAGAVMTEKALGFKISSETVRQVTESIGKQIFENDTQKAKQTMDNIINFDFNRTKKKITLYIMTDGAMVNTRVEDTNGSTWRENKTVMVFTDKDMIRRKDGTHIIVNKEYSAYIGTADEFRKYVFDLAVRHGYGQVERVVMIADGAAWIRNMCNELFPDAIQILDLFHLKENVYNYAKYKFKQDASQYVPWAEAINTKLENGQVELVINELPESEKLPSGVVNLRAYLENNQERLNYPVYKKMGLFVGSGAIESANKIIVQRRLKQAGMRWSVEGAQYVLTLRAKVESNQWDKITSFFCA